MCVALCCACLELWNTTSKPKWSSSARWQIPTNFNTQPPSSTSGQWSQPPILSTSIASSHFFKIASKHLRAGDLGGTWIKFWICLCIWECFARRPEVHLLKPLLKLRTRRPFLTSIIPIATVFSIPFWLLFILLTILIQIMLGITQNTYPSWTWPVSKPPSLCRHLEIRVTEPFHFRQCFGIRKERPYSRIHFKVSKRTSSSHKFVVAVQRRQVSLHPNQTSFSSRIWQNKSPYKGLRLSILPPSIGIRTLSPESSPGMQ